MSFYGFTGNITVLRTQDDGKQEELIIQGADFSEEDSTSESEIWAAYCDGFDVQVNVRFVDGIYDGIGEAQIIDITDGARYEVVNDNLEADWDDDFDDFDDYDDYDEEDDDELEEW